MAIKGNPCFPGCLSRWGMSQDIINEVYFLADSIVMGIIITFVYDFILIGRRVVRHNLFCISLEDFIFWAACAVTVFYMLYEENNGILRWFAVFGAALGMLLYKKIVGGRFVRLMSLLIKKEIHIIRKILGFILKPFLWIMKKFSSFRKFIWKRAKKIWKYMKKKLTLFVKMLKIGISKQ